MLCQKYCTATAAAAIIPPMRAFVSPVARRSGRQPLGRPRVSPASLALPATPITPSTRAFAWSAGAHSARPPLRATAQSWRPFSACRYREERGRCAIQAVENGFIVGHAFALPLSNWIAMRHHAEAIAATALFSLGFRLYIHGAGRKTGYGDKRPL